VRREERHRTLDYPAATRWNTQRVLMR